MLNKYCIIKYLDVETSLLFQFLLRGSVCEMFKFLLIYLNDLSCFRVLCFMFVLSCGNSLEDYFVFFWGVTVGNQSPGYRF